MGKQKIIRVLEGDKLPLDKHTETWNVVRVLNREKEGFNVWLYVLLERDEEDSQRKQNRHDAYLNAVQKAFS